MFLYGRDFLGLKKLVDPEVLYISIFLSLRPNIRRYYAQDVKHIKLTICGPEVAHFHHGSFAYDESVYACDGEYTHW